MAYIGAANAATSSPTYASHRVLVDGHSLTTSLGDLDAAVARIAGNETISGTWAFSNQVAFSFNGGAPFTVVNSTVVTNLNADLLDGLHAAAFIHADGSVAFSGNQDMGGHKITGAADPANPQEYATKAYVDAAVGGVGPFMHLTGGVNESADGNKTFTGIFHVNNSSLAPAFIQGDGNGVVFVDINSSAAPTTGRGTGFESKMTLGGGTSALLGTFYFRPRTDWVLGNAATQDAGFVLQCTINGALTTLLSSDAAGSVTAPTFWDFTKFQVSEGQLISMSIFSASSSASDDAAITLTYQDPSLWYLSRAANQTVTLPTVGSYQTEKVFIFVKTVAGGTATLDANGGTINGAATNAFMNAQYKAIAIATDSNAGGNAWNILWTN